MRVDEAKHVGLTADSILRRFVTSGRICSLIYASVLKNLEEDQPVDVNLLIV